MDDKTSIIPSTTVGPSCFRDDRKPVVKKKSRFPLFRGSKVKPRSSSNETTKQNKNSDKSSDDKNDSNNVDSPQYPANGNSAPNSPAPFSTPPRGTLRKYASANNLQDLANMGMSPSVSNDNLQEAEGSMSHSVSNDNLQEAEGSMSHSVSNDNLQEAEGSMSHSVSPYNLSDRPTTRHKHSVSTGNIPELVTKGTMSYSKSTSNLQDLKLGMRRYASALNLLDLNINEEVDAEEEGDDHELENCAEDVGIDDKADQFIAQFYQQMKSQHKPKRRQY